MLLAEHGPSYLFRCQVKSDRCKSTEKAPFRPVDGWSLLEATVLGGKANVELNGEPRSDIPTPIAAGKIALPGDVAAEYRNLVIIPINAKQ